MIVYWCLVLVCYIQISSCCHDGDIYQQPYSQSVNAGEDAQFHCYGRGTHLYWFINGVNTEYMTTEEITERGIQFSGDYNNNPPYYGGSCDIQDSYLIMAGSCINNNSLIYCFILGTTPLPPDGGNTTSNTATLTVAGDPTVIDDLTIDQIDKNTLLIRWGIISVTYTQSITIQDITNNTIKNTIITDNNNQYYWYELVDNPDLCTEYNITLNVNITLDVDTNNTCSNSRTVSITTGVPSTAENVLVYKQSIEQNYNIQFKINSSVCPGSIPSTIRLILINNNGGDVASVIIPWEQLTIITDGVYQTEWNNTKLLDNTIYQLLVIAQSTFGQTLSEPIKISTFDVTDIQYTLYNNELCLTCIFINDSQAIGCLVILSNDTTLQTRVSVKIYRSITNDSNCITLQSDTVNGNYIMTVYDWEQNGVISDKPVITTDIYINITINTSTTTPSLRIMGQATSYPVHSLELTTTIMTTEQTTYTNNSLAVTFGVLFGLCILLIIVAVITIPLILIMKHKLSKTNTAQSGNNGDEFTNVQMNSAYETVKIQHHRTDPKRVVSVDDRRPHDYEMPQPTDPKGVVPYEIVRYEIPDTPTYANVTY